MRSILTHQALALAATLSVAQSESVEQVQTLNPAKHRPTKAEKKKAKRARHAS